MKQKFKIPVVFTVKAESEAEAKQYVDRVMRHGFESIMEYERPTYKAINGWTWAAIRGAK